MKFLEHKILKVYAEQGPGWAEYHWDQKNKIWKYSISSELFMKTHNLPHQFDEKERLLLTIKLSNL
jgi:hypothetical protein